MCGWTRTHVGVSVAEVDFLPDFRLPVHVFSCRVHDVETPVGRPYTRTCKFGFPHCRAIHDLSQQHSFRILETDSLPLFYNTVFKSRVGCALVGAALILLTNLRTTSGFCCGAEGAPLSGRPFGCTLGRRQ
eukprot:scaffold1840_cov89-Cylindrotheca_fusiformis.AAC.2